MARTEPQPLSDRVYYLPGGVNCALVVGEDGHAVVVDSGQDKDYGRNLRRACEGLGVTPVAIVNTHAHADHFGGNAYLLRQFPDLEVYAPPFEASIIRSPYLEPVYLFHGARPIDELMSKWLQAEASPVHHELEGDSLELAGIAFEVLDTSGHAHRQVALRVDDVLLAADAFFGDSVLDKYALPFGQDIAGQLASFEVVRSSGARIALPGHGDPSSELDRSIDANVAAVQAAADAVADACTGGGTEDVLAGACEALGIALTDLPRYHLNLCTVSAYLSYLRQQGRVEAGLEGGRLGWRRVEA
ncbi:MAG: MBL fold metallo-hydrolase [Deinococcales bacterium]